MQNYYLRIEDMLSLLSHKLSIIKYVVLKKIIFFFLCFHCLIWTWTWLGLEPLWTRSWLGFEPLWTRSWLGLKPLWTRSWLGFETLWTRSWLGFEPLWTRSWLGLKPLWTRSWLRLKPLWTRSWLGLKPLWTQSWLWVDSPGLGLVLDSTKVDLTTALPFGPYHDWAVHLFFMSELKEWLNSFRTV